MCNNFADIDNDFAEDCSCTKVSTHPARKRSLKTGGPVDEDQLQTHNPCVATNAVVSSCLKHHNNYTSGPKFTNFNRNRQDISDMKCGHPPCIASTPFQNPRVAQRRICIAKLHCELSAILICQLLRQNDINGGLPVQV